jgi:endonuclease/exonuclease/phosphatase family metal-dependent hydrolase
MSRDPAFLAECQELKRAVERHATLAAMRAAPEWSVLEPRLRRILTTVRRHAPGHAPGAPADPVRVHAVHWNVEHGNWYEKVEDALLHHPQLEGADLLLFNEIDLGMARAGNRDVTADLCQALGRHGVWAPYFLETTLGRDDDPACAAGRENQESLFGAAILSRWPIGAARLVELPSPEAYQFDVERMVGRHAAIVAEILHPTRPFVAVSAHLEVHRTRALRAAQMRVLLEALRDEQRPILMSGDFNSHTFDRGRPWDPLFGAAVLMLTLGPLLRRRLLYPDRGGTRERLFDVLRDHGFTWEPYVDHRPTLALRLGRIDELYYFPAWFRRASQGLLDWAERRGTLRLDWFAGRGWGGGRGVTVEGLGGPGKASDHAPLVAWFE